MALPNADSPQPLAEEILAEARRERDQILLRAQQEAAALRAKAAAEAEQFKQQTLTQARAEAERQAELILATVPVEVGREHSAQVEAVLETIREEVRRDLQASKGFNYRETLVRLGVEAIGQMSGEDFVLKLSPADRTHLGERLAEEIARQVGRFLAIQEEPTITSGLIVQDTEGRQVWDNRLPTRLDRLWPELRRQIAAQTGLVGAVEPPRGGP